MEDTQKVEAEDWLPLSGMANLMKLPRGLLNGMRW